MCAADTKDPKRPFEQESIDTDQYFRVVHEAMDSLFSVGTEKEAAERERKYKEHHKGSEATQPTQIEGQTDKEGKQTSGSGKPRVEILTEPGRFVSAPTMCLVTRVIGKERRDGMDWCVLVHVLRLTGCCTRRLFIDTGTYGGFSGIMSDK